MSDYATPTTHTIRSVFADYWQGEAIPSGNPDREFFRAQFDRWLAAHDREVAAKALRDAADAYNPATGGDAAVAVVPSWLNDLAARIEATP